MSRVRTLPAADAWELAAHAARAAALRLQAEALARQAVDAERAAVAVLARHGLDPAAHGVETNPGAGLPFGAVFDKRTGVPLFEPDPAPAPPETACDAPPSP